MEHLGAQEALARALEALRPLTQAERDVVLLVLWSELYTPTPPPRSAYPLAPSVLGWPAPARSSPRSPSTRRSHRSTDA